MGTVVVATDRAEGLLNPELMEAIVNHAALALKRTRTEEALRESEQTLLDLTTTLESRWPSARPNWSTGPGSSRN